MTGPRRRVSPALGTLVAVVSVVAATWGAATTAAVLDDDTAAADGATSAASPTDPADPVVGAVPPAAVETERAEPAEPTQPAGKSGRGAAPGAQAVPGPGGAASADVAPRLRPARIAIPAIGVSARTGDLGIARDGSIEVPTDSAQAGWLDTTPAPGQQGPAVIAGHVDSDTGPAVFYRLDSLSPGDAIVITRRDGSTARFSVDGVRTYPQSDFPTREVYGPVPGPVLRLITCGGDYVKSRGGYQDNVVVYAS